MRNIILYADDARRSSIYQERVKLISRDVCHIALSIKQRVNEDGSRGDAAAMIKINRSYVARLQPRQLAAPIVLNIYNTIQPDSWFQQLH